MSLFLLLRAFVAGSLSPLLARFKTSLLVDQEAPCLMAEAAEKKKKNETTMNNNYYCRSIADDDGFDDGFDGRTRGRNEQHPPGCKCYSRAPNLSSVYEQSLEELKFQKSACHFAQIGNATKLRQLLEKDSERWTNSVDGPLSGLTPLHYASRNGHLECVRLLLEKKYVVFFWLSVSWMWILVFVFEFFEERVCNSSFAPSCVVRGSYNFGAREARPGSGRARGSRRVSEKKV